MVEHRPTWWRLAASACIAVQASVAWMPHPPVNKGCRSSVGSDKLGQSCTRAQLFGSSRSSSDDVTPRDGQSEKEKRIVFIRHGCTYMNEYLSSCRYGSPGFTDIFQREEERLKYYQDTPLSPSGLKQAQSLERHLSGLKAGDPSALQSLNLSEEHTAFIHELDLIVTSPLTRALQTLEIGLLPHVKDDVPVVALPLAAERLYLISDVGKPRSHLEDKFGHYADFQTGFLHEDTITMEHWWFALDDERDPEVPSWTSGIRRENYVEWRPNGQRQIYACPGEPDHHFESRMVKLYRWLDARPESTVAVVCHWGVIDWMLNEDFDNCEMRIVPFQQITPKSLSQQQTWSTSPCT